jgi:hypothetical protein
MGQILPDINAESTPDIEKLAALAGLEISNYYVQISILISLKRRFAILLCSNLKLIHRLKNGNNATFLHKNVTLTTCVD